MKAEEILAEAKTIVGGSRQKTHGSKERSFHHIAAMWNTYLAARDHGATITPVDVAQMLALLKIVRAAQGDGRDQDHYIDQAGYSGLAGELATEARPNEVTSDVNPIVMTPGTPEQIAKDSKLWGKPKDYLSPIPKSVQINPLARVGEKPFTACEACSDPEECRNSPYAMKCRIKREAHQTGA